MLVLTKPLGLGIITTAAKQNLDELGAISSAISLMTTLNRHAAEAMLEAHAHAATDITGFGLLGHLRNLAHASRVSAIIEARKVPVLEAARTYATRGIIPGGTHANRRYMKGEAHLTQPAGPSWVTFGNGIDETTELLLCDAQTSGGLLIAVAPEHELTLHHALQARSVTGWTIGRLESCDPQHFGQIEVR